MYLTPIIYSQQNLFIIIRTLSDQEQKKKKKKQPPDKIKNHDKLAKPNKLIFLTIIVSLQSFSSLHLLDFDLNLGVRLYLRLTCSIPKTYPQNSPHYFVELGVQKCT